MQNEQNARRFRKLYVDKQDVLAPDIFLDYASEEILIRRISWQHLMGGSVIIGHVVHTVNRDYKAMAHDYYALHVFYPNVRVSSIIPALRNFFHDALIETYLPKLVYVSDKDQVFCSFSLVYGLVYLEEEYHEVGGKISPFISKGPGT
ncbi:uncharacterized aarF domain-containing kinase At1g79600, chloroplastic [Olea europaea subsp. europaea]|uniref:Uncharacterized aarF domain-containing kinase At1g79600, chloroplastic n=1 Tax=Olea europaea subsp. europaea TaxID=158383 RepID=A0A8S0PMI2_OLEEU|nr:uncharacterized aarF domain-containing kinase At1g79600, chloroplastic [Olea europaea subsp. europaea]